MAAKKTGRKAAWDTLDMPSKLRSIQGWAKQGSTDKEMCAMLGIGHETFYKWKREKPEFAEAINKGKEVSNGEVLKSAFDQATGFFYKEQQAIKRKIGQHEEIVEIVEVERYHPPAPAMSIFMLKNRLPRDYKDKHEVQSTVTTESVQRYEIVLQGLINDKATAELADKLLARAASIKPGRLRTPSK